MEFDTEEQFDDFVDDGAKGLESLLSYFLGGQNVDNAIKAWFDTGVTDKSKMKIGPAEYFEGAAVNENKPSKYSTIAEKLAKDLKEGLPKGFWDKKIDAKDEDQDGRMNESKPVKSRKSHYNVEYHGVKHGHDDVANYPSFKQAVQKATQLKNDELFGYTLEDETDYIGVDGNGGNGEEFAIIYIDTRFFKSVNADDFGSKEDYTTWMKFAKKSLNSKKPVIGKYPNIGESQNKAQNEMLNNSMNESKPVKGKKSGKSEKAAKAIAGAVASYKAKGGGKGPTAKQK
jgi:hypothetical protein